MTQLQPDIFVNNRPDTDGDEEEDYFDYFYDEPGSEPGTLIIEPDAKPSRIILIDYDEDNAIRKVDITPNACAPYIGTNTVSWMDIQGLGSETVLKQVGEIFNLFSPPSAACPVVVASAPEGSFHLLESYIFRRLLLG